MDNFNLLTIESKDYSVRVPITCKKFIRRAFASMFSKYYKDKDISFSMETYDNWYAGSIYIKGKKFADVYKIGGYFFYVPIVTNRMTIETNLSLLNNSLQIRKTIHDIVWNGLPLGSTDGNTEITEITWG